ncbi:MAG: hypothetical protein ABI397_01290 [Candidatus Saccharimonas sp.]
MDLLKSRRRRSRLSDITYIGLNIGLAVALFLIVSLSQTVWLAILVVLLGKWRTLAVRPRFWFANIIANTVDIIVGVSTVVFLSTANGSMVAQIVITVLYVGWLLLLKPRTKRSLVASQAGVAVFVGITALSIISFSWPVVLFVLAMWGIGYVSARHVLGSYDEPYTVLYSSITGFVFAELGWIGFHWLMGYNPLDVGDLKLSQLALYMTLGCFIAERAYASFHKNGKVQRADVILPIGLTVAVVLATFIFALIFGSDAL